MTKPEFVMETFIDCTHDALWDALTRSDLIARYHFASSHVAGDYTAAGDRVDYHFPDTGLMLSNKVIAITPKSRIEMEFHPNWGADKTASRCVYLLTPGASGMKLTIEHFDLPATQSGVREGWARFAGGLKTFLETGRAHRFAPEMAQ